LALITRSWIDEIIINIVAVAFDHLIIFSLDIYNYYQNHFSVVRGL